MDDQSSRREAKSFEPPPWEREAFERFQEERAEREKEEALDAALAAVQEDRPVDVTEAQPKTTPGPGECPEDSVGDSASGDSTGTEAPTAAPASESEHPAATRSKESRVDAMLLELRAEEPRVRSEYRGLSIGVAIMLAAAGLGFVIWAAVLFAKAGGVSGQGAVMATMGSLLVMIWGFMLIVFGALLWRKLVS